MQVIPREVPSANKLNDYLRTELSAVDTYSLALDAADDPTLVGTLRQLRDNHHHRVSVLISKIRDVGKTPAQSAGTWGAFVKLVQAGADLFGDRAAIACLEQFEDRMLAIYNGDVP